MGKANTHLTHLEELVLTQGPEGYEMARAFLLELLKTLKGNTESSVQTSVKWDGAPAMFVGVNPENGRFFVGTKSIFNKVPKINYTEEDIIKNHGHAPGLVDKLTKALKYLPSLGIKKILQGDFMFDDEMIDTVNIDGEPHYRFKPNTIVYAVPVNSELGQQIGQSKFGIVFHTTYDSLDSGASFGADVSNLKRVPGIWFDDAYFTDDTGTVTLTEEEETQIISLVSESESVNKSINYDNLPLSLLNIYINSEIKGGNFLENPDKSFEGFKEWYSGRLSKRIEKLKSAKGKERATRVGKEELQKIESRKGDIMDLFKVSRLLFEAKNIFIQKYNNAVYNTKHFVDDGSGDLIASNPEGYVAVDHAGNGIKFVDRLEFSRANFAVDKSAKFTGDAGLTEDFSVVISKDVTVTKTLQEWVDEISTKNHEFVKLPEMVYKDILAGIPVVDIVVQENAEKTIYNAVMGYVNGLQEEEDESDDPVVDSDFPKTVAIVPGAFKPPHKGHLDMVRAYADNADEVIVLISKPTKSGRKLPNGREITSDDSLRIWDVLTSDLPNVTVSVSDHASPINAAYEYVGEEGPLEPGTRVILGASTKGNDASRWASAEKYVKNGVKLLPPDRTAVNPTVRASGEPYSATDFRNALGGALENRAEIADFVGEENVDEVLSILGLETPIKEMSPSGAGAGYAGPLGSTLANRGPLTPTPKKKKKKQTKQKEYIDLSLIDEVMKLIIERGIVR